MNKLKIILILLVCFYNCIYSNNYSNKESIIDDEDPIKSNSESIKNTIKIFKKKYCFKSTKTPNNSFIKRSNGKENALKEFKFIFREKDQGGGLGNLKKIKLWASNNEWKKIRKSHYDWWMFPNDQGSSKEFAFDEELLTELSRDKAYVSDYIEGVRLVLLAWGWDLNNNKFVENPHPDQRWDGYAVRLMKIIYSLILLEQAEEYESVCKFIISIIKRDHGGVPYEDIEDWKWINIYAKVKERLKNEIKT